MSLNQSLRMDFGVNGVVSMTYIALELMMDGMKSKRILPTELTNCVGLVMCYQRAQMVHQDMLNALGESHELVIYVNQLLHLFETVAQSHGFKVTT